MAQSIADMPVALLPLDIFSNLVGVAKGATFCAFDPGDGSKPVLMSSYKYLEQLASDPDRFAPAWKQALVSAGVVVGGTTAGLGALIVATGPLAPFTAIGAAIAAPFFGANRVATLVVCNATMGDMKLAEIYQDCGVQTGHPVYADTDIDTGSVRATRPDCIPGVTQLVPGLMQAGVGMYRFEKNLDLGIGFYGTGGAISWSFADPTVGTTMALAWLVPETGSPGLAVTADLGKYSSLQDFYDKTAGARKVDLRARVPGGGKIEATGTARTYPTDTSLNDMVITVYCGT